MTTRWDDMVDTFHGIEQGFSLNDIAAAWLRDNKLDPELHYSLVSLVGAMYSAGAIETKQGLNLCDECDGIGKTGFCFRCLDSTDDHECDVGKPCKDCNGSGRGQLQ